MRVGLEEESNDNRTVYCGNLTENVTDGIIFELFQQVCLGRILIFLI